MDNQNARIWSCPSLPQCHNRPCQWVNIALDECLDVSYGIWHFRNPVDIKKSSKFWEAVLNCWGMMRYQNYSHATFTNSSIATELKNKIHWNSKINHQKPAPATRCWNWETMSHDHYCGHCPLVLWLYMWLLCPHCVLLLNFNSYLSFILWMYLKAHLKDSNNLFLTFVCCLCTVLVPTQSDATTQPNNMLCLMVA